MRAAVAGGRLDGVLAQLVDAVMADDVEAARLSYAEAQAEGLLEQRLPALVWAERERLLAAGLPDVPRTDTPGAMDAALRRLRGAGA